MQGQQAADPQRERLIEAAVELMAKRGYHGTSIELIIRRAKVGYATFYKYFSGKEECLIAIFETATAGLRPRLEGAYEARQGPWAEKVGATLEALFRTIAEQPAMARVCLVEVLAAGPVAIARYERALADFEPLLLPGRRERPRNAELPEILESTLFGGVFWIAYQRLTVGAADRLIGYLPETIELVLTPYVGGDEAVRVADEFGDQLAEPG